MSIDKPEMTTEDVIEIMKLLGQNDIDVIIDGGWGVDALLRKQTRTHQDLDVAVMYKDLPKIRVSMHARGYQEIPRDDSWECNFVLGDDQGHLFDLHSCTFDETGNNIFGVKYPYGFIEGNRFDQWLSCQMYPPGVDGEIPYRI